VGEDTSKIEHQIDAERQALGHSLDELEQKARDFVDWRTHYRNHPTVFLGAAVGAGVVLGMLSNRGHGHVGNGHPAEMTAAEHFAEPHRAFTPARERGPKTRELVDTWDRITAALLGVAIAKVVDVVSDYVPGFRNQYDVKASRIH
jgi:hypothetical protein